MSQVKSVSAKRPYGLVRVCRVWKIARSSVYAHRRSAAERESPPKKRGPKGPCSDEELVEMIKEVQKDSPWVNEGHRKVWARLRQQRGVRTSRRRVLRLMRENDLLAVVGPRRERGPRDHSGTIIPEAPNRMWGTDATASLTGEGQATIFFVIDHATAECLGIHCAKRGTRFEAIETLRRAVRGRFDAFDRDVAAASELCLRHDNGSQFVSHAFQDELKFLGITSSASYVREPEGNGCAERFVRTLKEQLLWLRRFETVDELEQSLQGFKDRYNTEWLIERHGWVSPAAHLESITSSALTEEAA